ncbi:FAD-dependent oxidoreductase [Ilumatobacter nonamiensis]|uniref:FAD-dependent oxidoreductase n=1 Tax=Ilumatobacter nonamiensis TaxID=467093 RepID=UPI00058B4A32|nr:GMC family oxidoreductase [Ilumatobacter nonamiensis]
MTRAVHHDCDVLIVGSGAGGATTAAVLAEAGHDVLIVEEGSWVEQGSTVPFSLDQMDKQYRSGGVTVALGLPSIAYTEGRCAGGGTEVNSGLYWRPPEATLELWRTKYQIRDFASSDLLDICAEVESELSVQKVPGEHTDASDILRRGADRLGWRNDEIPRWMTYPEGAGATEGQRQSMTRTYLPRAFASGARILCDHRLDKITRSGRRATGAELTHTVDGESSAVTVAFRDVIVCGGAIQTPAILQRTGLRHRVGRTLAVHPTVKLAARFDDPVNTPEDVSVFQVKQFAPNISFGGSASHPGLVALALTDNWRDFGSAVTAWPELAIYYAAITSEGRGLVQAIPGVRDPLVTYRLTKRDRDLLGQGLARLAMVMLEAGAEEVYPSFKQAPIVRDRADLATMTSMFAASKASVMTVHLCSTAPMGDDERRCATDSHGLVHGTDNVFVNDAALLPEAPGVNPQASVMAIAIRNARRYCDERAG